MVAYSNGYKTAYSEIPFALSSPTFGVLPPDLSGTYYRSGPAMFSAGSLPPPKNSLVRPRTPPAPDGSDPGRMVRHPFEGDGAVLAITFHGGGRPPDGDRGGGGDAGGEAAPRADTAGKATTRFRYVRTNAFTNERKRGKKLYSGMEGTRIAGGASGSIVGNDLPSPPFHRHHLLPGLNKMRKNTSNTRAVYFGRKLLSLWSGGLPYKLDALALSTDGRSQLGGVVKREDCSMGGKAAIDSKRNRILFYGIDEEQGSSTLNLYEFNSKFQPIRDNDGVVRAKLPGLAMIHDFAVTENYAIFVQPVLKVNGMQFMISKEPGKSVSLEAESSVRGGFRFSIRSGAACACRLTPPPTTCFVVGPKILPRMHHSGILRNISHELFISLTSFSTPPARTHRSPGGEQECRRGENVTNTVRRISRCQFAIRERPRGR
jgi:all-trans-8'-apo-beta-carotenal 15,15'-oxygenase